jgi:maleylacetoacetate isomerase/maleylpyruvate isomerase
MSRELVLYSYWRSSAAYRVRIALNLKQLDYQVRPVNLIRDGGEQHVAAYRALNPQEQVPTLLDGDHVLCQSMAIVEYLDETRPDVPLMPADPAGRARVRALAQLVACDIHPVGNLRVLQMLETQFGAAQEQKAEWSRHWISLGLHAMEAELANNPSTGRFCHGDMPTLADICLVPQVYNAVRWHVDLSDCPNLMRIQEACTELDAFRRAAPEMQVDAPTAV